MSPWLDNLQGMVFTMLVIAALVAAGAFLWWAYHRLEPIVKRLLARWRRRRNREFAHLFAREEMAKSGQFTLTASNARESYTPRSRDGWVDNH